MVVETGVILFNLFNGLLIFQFGLVSLVDIYLIFNSVNFLQKEHILYLHRDCTNYIYTSELFQRAADLSFESGF